MSTRNPAVLTVQHREERCDYAKLLLAPDHLGFHLVFIDEHAINASKIKPYAWAKQGETSKIVTGVRG